MTTSPDSRVVDEAITNEVARAAATVVGRQVSTVYLENVFLGFTTLQEQLSDAASGATELADGANTAADGAAELPAGANQLADGAGQLADANQQLASGASNLSSGASTRRRDVRARLGRDATRRRRGYCRGWPSRLGSRRERVVWRSGGTVHGAHGLGDGRHKSEHLTDNPVGGCHSRRYGCQ